MRKTLFALLLVVALATRSSAEITLPHSFTSGTPILAAAVNANFAAVADGAFAVAGDTLNGNMAVDTNVTIDGVDISDFLLATGHIHAGVVGTEGAPAFAMTTDQNSGLYFPTGDQVAVSTNGSQRFLVTNAGASVTGTFSASSSLTGSIVTTTTAGTVDVNAFSQGSDANTGIYFPDANELAIAADGADVAHFTAAGVNVTGSIGASTSMVAVSHLSGNGSTVAPSYTATADTDTGMFFPAANQVGISAGNTHMVTISSTGASVDGTLTATGLVLVNHIRQAAVVSLAGVNGNNNNVALSTAYSLYVNTDAGAGVTLTGMAGGLQGREIVICATGTGASLAVTAADTNSSVGNRFTTPGNATQTIPGGSCRISVYDDIADVWRIVGAV